MSDNRTDLPSPGASNFEQRVREVLMTYLGRQGDPLDRGLTLRDLLIGGVVKIKEGYTLRTGSTTVPLEPTAAPAAGGGGGGGETPPDLTPPPTPTGFTAVAAISHVLVEHDAPIYTQGGGHLRTRLYGKVVAAGDPTPTFADAVEIAQFSGEVFSLPSNPSTTWHLWVKWETADGVVSSSPAGGTNGVSVTTGQNVSSMVQAMTGAGNPFTILTTPTVIGGVTFPAGTYSQQAFIQDGQITNAKIANLAVDNAKIASVAVDKLTAGSIAVGQHIQSTGYVAGTSGWRIDGNGNAELSNATVRGTVFASSGSFTGAVTATSGSFTGTVQASTTILGGSATAYASGSGFYSGLDSTVYKWRVGNPTGTRIQFTGTAVEVYNDSNVLTFSSGSPPAGSTDWANITNKPAFGIFATAPQITSANVSTYIASAAVGSAQIGSISLVGTSNFSVRSATSGARMEMDSRAIRVFDASGVKRVQIGDLTV